ncbi:MAG: D-alanyl-D-alanine carboxypeptidase/D-alanyl-D-alanine-endopeptidase [Actinomycetota bacterium]|jgi:D-alanyl-D-alanine carboxypeptidase/D-alanyl-D-alanine-endopeptidase (penicillin-binding protein 4)
MTDDTTAPEVRKGPSPYVVAGLVAAIVAAAAFAGGFFFGPGGSAGGGLVADSRVVPDNPSAAFPVRTCSIADAMASPDLKTATAYIMNADTDEILYQFGADPAVPMGSVMKVITAATALDVLGPDATLTTRVVKGSTPGSVIIIGGGDPTLSAGNGSVYANAPTITDLAQQTVTAYYEDDPSATPITEVIVDLSLFPVDDAWDPSWPTSERVDGYQPKIVPLLIDGDRANAKRQTSPRSKDPVDKAVKAFVNELENAGGTDGQTPVNVRFGTAPSNATELASVSSQPVATLIKQMLPMSDNALAEYLLRAVSVKLGQGGTAASLPSGIVGAMKDRNIDFSTSTFVDGSGESPNIKIDVAALATLLDLVFADGSDLAVIADNLPVAGKSGTLADRFTGDAKIAVDHVIAKTGSISGVRALAGKIEAADGTNLIAIVVAQGKVGNKARAALDNVFAGAYTCGNNLSSY